MSLTNNIKEIQRLTRKAGVSSYKTDIVEACEQLSYNLNLTLSTSERQEVADYLIKQVSSKMTVSSPQSIGNVTLQDQPSDVGTVNESAITPAVQNALNKVQLERPEMMLKAKDIANSYQQGNASEEETVKQLILLSMYERVQTVQELQEMVEIADSAIAAKYNQLFGTIQAMTDRSKSNAEILSKYASDLEKQCEENQQKREQEMEKFKAKFRG